MGMRGSEEMYRGVWLGHGRSRGVGSPPLQGERRRFLWWHLSWSKVESRGLRGMLRKVPSLVTVLDVVSRLDCMNIKYI